MTTIKYFINKKAYITDGIIIQKEKNHQNGFLYVAQLTEKHQKAINDELAKGK